MQYKRRRQDAARYPTFYTSMKRDGATFLSDDAYGRLATVTGALWTPQGRSFDGTDDKISYGNAAAFGFTLSDSFTCLVWGKTSESGSMRALINKGKATLEYNGYWLRKNAADQLNIQLYGGGGGFIGQKSNTDINDGFFHLWGFSYNGTSASAGLVLLQDGNVLTSSADEALVLGPDLTNSSSLYAGASANGTGEFWNGIIDEVLLCNRVLSLAEVQQYYLATRWRYR